VHAFVSAYAANAVWFLAGGASFTDFCGDITAVLGVCVVFVSNAIRPSGVTLITFGSLFVSVANGITPRHQKLVAVHVRLSVFVVVGMAHCAVFLPSVRGASDAFVKNCVACDVKSITG